MKRCIMGYMKFPPLSTADIFHSLGDTQRALGDLSSAHQSQERALKIRQKLFGKEHVNIADSTVDI